MAWRLAHALTSYRDAVNARWPGRDKASDGGIGNAAHATRDSDHNPWIVVDDEGVVRAYDIDKDGIDADWLAEQLRLAGAAGDPRLTGGGYVIWNRHITTPDFTGWKPYTGTNPHTGHIHLSLSRNVGGFDSRAPWTFLEDDDMPLSGQDVELIWRRPLPENHGIPILILRGLSQQVAGLQAAVSTLADAVASGRDDLTADELRTVIREEMANVVDVQVTVRDGDVPPSA